MSHTYIHTYIHTLAKNVIDAYRKWHAEKPERFYNIDGFDMDLGDGHMLQLMQKYNPMYDRFVPYLGMIADEKNIPNGIIVDIGANVGDTVAAFIRHTKSNAICVEPTQKFYNLCKKNINGFGHEYTDRISLVNAYVSDVETTGFVSEVIDGTAIKRTTASDAEAPTYTLPNIVGQCGYDMEQLSVIKIDTDGYDADCIFSLGEELRNISPVIFWENQIDDISQYEKYVSMGNFLYKSGYNDFFVFDNYGNYLCHTDKNGYVEINNYIKRMLNKKSTRSFFYVDVLAAKETDVESCHKAIEDYLQRYD